MPAIRKIRIVNLRFNDGAKLIPDEIFCTESDDGKPINTLFNLDNGGGKTVLVQLMLQPVCPKARVQNRNISDYFQKGTDHAFILIEWALDNSSNSLLTGIALAASTTADDENESKSVRFYTFIHDYSRLGDKLDLINLPLTEKTGNRIRPMSFDELRKYLQNRRVEYYPSDSLRRYQKRLEEYGIFHTEWENILVRINSVEGGITKFFEEYKTADRLLDKFIIPGVMPNDNASAEALEEMFVNYADSYAGQEENLRLQSQITAFTEKLQGILPLIKDMWNAEDSKLQSMRSLADHVFTLDCKIKADTDRQAQLENNISALKEKLCHIKAEKASESYYLAEESLNKASAQLELCRQQKEEADKEREQFAHKVSVLNAAKEFAELTQQQNEEKALSAQLRELEQGTRDSRILSLKYSLSLLADQLKQETDRELLQETNVRKKYSDALCVTKEKIGQLRQQYSDENNCLHMTMGQKDYLLEQIGHGLTALSLHITVMLDGEYSKEDITNIRLSYDNQLKLANEGLNNYYNEEIQLEKELDTQDEERNQLIETLADFNARLKQHESALEQYNVAYNGVLPILEHLSIPKNRLFTDEPTASIDTILSKLKEQLRKAERSAELLSEQLRCTEAGQLHISKTAVSFLQETGISYQTGEQYLQLQSPKVREAILSVNPLAAYAVLVNSEKEREKLLSQSADTWLSAVVPIYTRSELADMADGKWDEYSRFLSAYDTAYFRDKSHYREQIRQKLDDVNTEIEQLNHQTGEWETERKALSEFTYSDKDEVQMQKAIADCREEIQSILNKLSDLDKRKSEIRKRTEEIHRLKEQQQKNIRNAENNKAEFERVCEDILKYEKLSIKITEANAHCRSLSKSIDNEQAEEKRVSELIQEYDEKIKQLHSKLTEYRELFDELKGTSEAEVLSEEYSVMLAEYRLYQESYSADRQKLQRQLEKLRESIRDKANGIGRFHIEPSEYENTEYSDEAYRHAEEQSEDAKRKYKQISEDYAEADKYNAIAESKLNNAKDKLDELHTELLPRSEVGSDFERRIGGCESELQTANSENLQCGKRLNKLNSERTIAVEYKNNVEMYLTDYTPKIITDLQKSTAVQKSIDECIEQLRRAESQAKNYHHRKLEPFRDKHSLFTGTLDGILSVIDNHSIVGDKYFTLYERTEDDIKRYRDRIAQLAIMLKDVEDSRKQLVTNCRQRAGRLYENLTILSKKSTIQIDNVKRQMIRIELPEIEPMSEQPTERIGQYITEQVKKYLSEQEKQRQSHQDHLNIRRLLNSYIGKESIPITVFKIDKNIQNCRYRSWQDALKANSGGEQFVVFFSLIVSVMNYTRSLTGSLSSTSGVLILDNPFGPISSEHLLEPMFSIARHFHIQLICLTHLGTAAVTSFFDMVYQLRFKNLPLSNVEILESEAKQHMEHAFYLSEQLSMF